MPLTWNDSRTEDTCSLDKQDCPLAALDALPTEKFRTSRKYYLCGGNIHFGGRNDCPSKDKIRYKCDQKSHFLSVCQSECTNGSHFDTSF